MIASPTILVLGATGMLGHKLVERLSREFVVFATLRGRELAATPAARSSLGGAKLLFSVNAEYDADLDRAFETAQPTVVVNSVGIVKQLKEAQDPIASIAINALLPHRVAARCRALGDVRLIHFSTDCVFSGRRGPYFDADTPDALDLYGRTKVLGEVSGGNCLTLRSSIVGRELQRRAGLIEWFLAQRDKRINGFTRAWYTGVTTRVMADLVAHLVKEHPKLEGVWQVASNPTSKFELLSLVEKYYKVGVDIQKDEKFHCDRRLDGSRFSAETGFVAPDWETMIAEMHDDPIPYSMSP
jgi:dTDP-4-dehydrorhamnose reductase